MTDTPAEGREARFADIRQGDIFQWSNRTLLAVDDARHSFAGGTRRYGDFHDLFCVKPHIAKKRPDGVYDPGGALIDCIQVLSDFPVRILRSVPVHAPGYETMNATTAAEHLAYVMRTRADVQRALDDADERRDILVRRLLHAGRSVEELAEVTGLSKARIYQIRDSRR